ncbi:MAG TPA: CPBP family intramembrane glutamic endopeptidase [Chlamydiales bacterium]|nr:CPBP family intramembrane glutamic endopeptidase [Chlamydiales bacterium]
MKKFVLPFIYVSFIFSSDSAPQTMDDFLVANEPVTFISDQNATDFSSINAIASEEFNQPSPILESNAKRPLLAASLSAIFPGLGQMYIGDMKSAGIMAGSAAGSVAGIFASVEHEDEFNENILVPCTISYSTNLFYSVYSAYRDARFTNGITNYSFRMPTEQLRDLTYAPFQLSILKKPEVWGSIIGAVLIAKAIGYLAYPKKGEIKIAASTSPLSPAIMPVLSLPIAVGEESFFRGFLQSAISENLNPMAGLAISSLAFGAAHIPNAQALEKEHQWRYYSFSLPLITALGAYCGWMTQQNHSLKESVALHMWYDFILFSIDAMTTEKASIGPKQYAISIPF